MSPTSLPAGPLGARAQTLLDLIEQVRTEGVERFDFDAFDGMIGVKPEEPAPLEQRRRNWQQLADRFGGGRVLSVDQPDAHELRLEIESPDGSRWLLMVGVEADPPHRIEWFGHRQALGDRMVIRDAVAVDGPALDALERHEPVVAGDREVWVERSDYFDCCRLMAEPMYVVADDHGDIVGGMGGGKHPARIGGVDYRMGYAHHLRIHRDHQRRGIWGHLADAWYERYPLGDALDCSYGYVARDNEVMQRAWRDMDNKWPVGPSRFLIDCAATGTTADSSGSARVAAVDDIPVIVEILNEGHRDEEVWSPHAVDSFTTRVTRAPDLYEIGDVLIAEGDAAVVGVWAMGTKAVTVIRSPVGERRQRRAIAVDHAFRPGHEDAYGAVLRGWCARLAARGLTHLTVYSSPRSPGWHVLEDLAAEREDFDYWTPQIAVPGDAADKGVYVDPIYF